jgi:hypothetical protein
MLGAILSLGKRQDTGQGDVMTDVSPLHVKIAGIMRAADGPGLVAKRVWPMKSSPSGK